MHPQQPPPPPPPPYGYVPPGELYLVGQDEQPGYVHRPERDNPHAITAFSFGICGLALLVLSFGIGFLVAIPCAIVGIVLGRRAVKAVDEGEATRHRNYARAGFVNGVVTVSIGTFIGLSFLVSAIFPDAFEEGEGEFGALPLVRAVRVLVSIVTGS